MDVLRKEINGIYSAQNLGCEFLDKNVLAQYNDRIAVTAAIDNACWVITDASADYCYVHTGTFGRLLGLTGDAEMHTGFGSSDEDIIYNRIHPEDLVGKRMLEYDFLKFADKLNDVGMLRYKAVCRIRIRNNRNEYMYVNNSTQVLQRSPNGRIWLILCGYDLSPEQSASPDIFPRIINNETGETTVVSLTDKRAHILTGREKEVLRLIKKGKLSKEIADVLGISVHTVNRHRQNILEKLSVGNSMEAVTAAMAMRIL